MKNLVVENRRLMVLLVLLGLFLAPGLSAVAAESLFTRYNIHVQDQLDRRGNHVYQASYANYTDPGPGHMIIPAGSPVVIEKKSRKGFSFLSQNEAIRVDFEFHQPRMGMDVDQYIGLITSNQPLSLQKFSSLDRKGIKEGKALVGMTRDGVMTALGYPAAHRTPSLENTTWVYWTNRFRTLAVDFDDKGKVRDVRN